jgi:catechol 2,3-dioxygenase-like lactoylglutathione lyase family enzyme
MEVEMSSPDTASGGATTAPSPSVKPGEMWLEVVTLPVSDVDRAKSFYEGLGWKMDIDFEPGPGLRGVQLTPPGSPCSIQFGIGGTTAEPGSAQGIFLVVSDIEEARAQLIEGGADVGEVNHRDENGEVVSGPDPEGRSYFSRASFEDPDGNTWVLQQVTDRLPGR